MEDKRCTRWRCGLVWTAVCALLLLSRTQSVEGDAPEWGEWGEATPCSRSCGVGVSYRQRTCPTLTADGTTACVGPTRHYSTCNTQDCPPPVQNVRLQQCEEYNNISFDDEHYEWVPHYGGANSCELNCLAKGQTFYYRHKAKVTDGTPCGRNTRDICIDGVCQGVGCDLVLGSKLTLDKCGQCGGDGSTCSTYGGYLDTDHLNMGYNDLILVPAGAMSISFEETRPGNNYLALRDLAGNFILNGDWKIETSQDLPAAGTSFTYKRGPHPSDKAETLTSNGPTTEPLFFSVLRQPGSSPQVAYEYSLPVTVHAGSTHTYAWRAGPWSHCSASCGHGEQTRVLSCQRTADGKVVNEDLCNPQAHKAATKQACLIKACPASWNIGDWQHCSTSCGAGVRARTVFCQRPEKGDLVSVVDDDECKGANPTPISKCNEEVSCPKWQVGKWSECNRVCGLGQQTRTVYCLAQHPLDGTSSDILPSTRCDVNDHPISARECNEGPCDGLEWVSSSWSGCIGECGHKMETRRVVCSSKVGEVFNDTMCDSDKRPDTSRPCPANTDCAGHTQWHASQWSQCSAQCGPGKQARSIFCVMVENGSFKQIDEKECDPDLRMERTRNCTGESCWGIWFRGPWGKCSAECGSGKMKREVLCFYGDQVATASDCDEGTRPLAHEVCNVQPCTEENEVSGCKNTEFGCCPDGETPAEGTDYFGCQAKDRIPTGSCVEMEFGCCLDGVTPAQGPFNAGCPYFTCKDMEFGCCPDGQTPAAGPKSVGCPEQFGCAMAAYGCCPDGVTFANGVNNEGCEAQAKTCANSKHGCCPDGVTEAAGPEQAGCDSIESSGEVCEETAFGCCPNGITAATGPNQEGCNELTSSCGFSLHGCCPDGATAAEGPNSIGCPGVIIRPIFAPCSLSTHGCCPDGETAAFGKNGYGCNKIEINCTRTVLGCCDDGVTVKLSSDNEGCPAKCVKSQFGCCPDGFTAAKGSSNEGCILLIGGCAGTRYGCCPDGSTYASGDNYEGCRPLLGGCRGTRYGCCPDNATYAYGPYYQGCNVTKLITECDMTTHGCCLDGQAVAAGANFKGCLEEGTYLRTCNDSPYGCCPDNVSPADGPNNTGCPSLINRGASCGMKSETGPCSNFTIMWYFDILMGDCTRFWYGGCDGNENRFNNREECQSSCIKPDGIMTCYLPKSVGRCRAADKAFYYNPENRECEEFEYGGCLGNGNRFQSHKGCEDKCITPQSPDVCSQPHMPGPCRGNFERWFYDKTTGHCRQFIYGGCMGNENRFESAELCEQRCQQSAVKICQLKMDTGPCRGVFDKFYFDAGSRTCKPFIYGGCHGNSNRFSTVTECQSFCHELAEKVVDVCLMPQDSGPCKAYMQRWYFDAADGYCKQFVYGGCDGNGNRFETEEQCRTSCNAKVPVDPCAVDIDAGPCEAYSEHYAYDRSMGSCVKFVYGGCEGNENRFTTNDECKKACPDAKDEQHVTDSSPAVRDVCSMEKDAGPCFAYQTRFFYDPLESECMSFTYGGCQGNANNFETLERCQAQCRSHVATGTKAATESSDICMAKLDSGPCYEWESRYFYNTSSKTCEHFFYGGCQGNGNNFASLEECGYHCTKQTTTPRSTTTTEVVPEPVVVHPAQTNVCHLEKDPGPCYAHVTKYHYDVEQRACVQFVYGGCLGNHNNFETIEKCEAYCSHTEDVERPTTTDVCTQPRESGPCYGSMTRFYYDPTDGRCLHFTFGGCLGNENNFGTIDECTAKCGGRAPTTSLTGNRCDQPKDAGMCLNYLPRYYYDSASATCRQFIYGGCEGNRNRFMAIENCREACVIGISTTTIHIPDTPLEQSTVTSTTVEMTEDICKLRQDEGECRGYEPSWYYDTERAACQAFIWGGCGGNANRFNTMEACLAKCAAAPTKNLEEPSDDIVGLAVCGLRNDVGPCRESLSRWYYDLEEGICAQFVYGGCRGNENNFESREACTQACPIKDLCELPSETGRCRAAKRRYFYNHHVGECMLFTYGGCAGNANRFLAKQNCESVCASQGSIAPGRGPGEETDVCTLGMDAGPCASYQQFWFYSQTEHTCREFTYGGCLGNGNRFAIQEECLQHCDHAGVGGLERTTPWTEDTRRRTHDAHTAAPTPSTTRPSNINGDVCDITKDPGTCTDYTPVWYFELNSRTCRRFLYGGCEGNGNRFDSRLACESSCLYGEGTVPMITTTQAPLPQRTTTSSIAETAIEYDLCTLESDAGPCRNNITVHWYFNNDGKRCQRFLYGGCGGNANRFADEKNCKKICILREKKALADVCQNAVDKGPCNDTVPSWHFNPHTGRCHRFDYGGCEGNANRFVSEHECQQKCTATAGGGAQQLATPAPLATTTSIQHKPTTTVIEHSKTKDVCWSSVNPGPCQARIRRWYFDSTQQICKDFLYGGCHGNGNNFASKEKCQVYCNTNVQDVCMLPAAQGPCSAGVRKWYYNYAQSVCQEFTYGGCLGNENQFDSEELCRAECGGTIAATTPSPVTAVQCAQPAHQGPCFGDYLRYFFDQSTDECRPFIFGGCQANDNNFITQKECYAQCGDPNNKYTIRSPGDCYLAPDAGPCRNSRPRYHFNPAIGDCVAFYYGGCDGNGNNFGQYDDCIAMCSRATVSCGVLSCDLKCPGEFGRGPDGCLQCRCKDPCERYECEEGLECEVQQVQCITTPCPEQAVCVPRPRDGECPELDILRMGSCDSPCERDAGCPGIEKCCSSSCGNQCTPPTGPEEQPDIVDTSDEDRMATLGDSVVLTCASTGSPKPQITWFKDGFPVLADDTGRYAELGDSLEIRQIDETDNALFTCRAYNGVGSSATKAYTLTISEPVTFGEMQSLVTVNSGSTAMLDCVAYGKPEPRISWLRGGSELFMDGLRITQASNNSLVIEDLTQDDAGDYVCTATNDVGSAEQRIIVLDVIDLVSIAERQQLSIVMLAHNTSYTVGGEIRLHCVVTGGGDITTSWTKDGAKVVFDDRITSAEAELRLVDAVLDDAGTYRCMGSRGDETVNVETRITITELSIPEDCADKPWLANCLLIVQAHLCRHVYFSDFCCESCHKAGQLP